MELHFYSFIIFSLTTLTITSSFDYTSAFNYDKEVIEADPTVKRNITVVKEPDFEEQKEGDDNSMQVKFPTHEGIVTSDRKDTDEFPGVPPSIPTELPEADPCMPTPCRMDFWPWCEEFNGTARCACLQTYFRSPPRCIGDCTINSECNADMACIHNRCSDPCPGVCGYNAQCHVINHQPQCTCLPGLIGNPFDICDVGEPTLCSSSPCGPNSQCTVVKDQAVCRCQKQFMGTPPHCGLECTNNSECASDKACLNHKCVDPCVNQCDRNANCTVIAHNPICSCQDQFTGDAFSNGEPLPLSISTQRPEVDPCTPSPCGPHSQCQEFNGHACCTCLPNYISFPPRCRPECTINSECNADMACINNRCTDPCLGACGTHTRCYVHNHVPYCSCFFGYIGDAFIGCYKIDEGLGGYMEWKKKTGWPYDFPPYCVADCIMPLFVILPCPSGSERLNDICVGVDE